MKHVLSGLFLLLCLSVIAAPISAEIPRTFNYQGTITDKDGMPLNETVRLTFALFPGETGGEALWSEIHESVPVDNGVYQVVIGNQTPFALAFDNPYYLEVTVGSDDPLAPRHELTSVPYALNASGLEAEGVTISNGKVGIGVSNPTDPLEVEGMIDADWLDIRNVHIHGEEEYGHGLHLYTPTARMVITEDNNTPGWIRFRPWAGEGFMFSNNGDTPVLTIAESGHVLAYSSLRVKDELSVTVSGPQGIGLTTSNTALKIYEDRNTPGWIRFRPYHGEGFMFSNNGDTARLTIREDGKIGIGTLNPTHELTVNGTIRARDQILDPNGPWPDYVFDDEYRLMPLDELAQYLKTHKHLPDVPTRAEVIEEGVSVSEMQAALLQKVEELTLHMIALQAENERLKARLSNLEHPHSD